MLVSRFRTNLIVFSCHYSPKRFTWFRFSTYNKITVTSKVHLHIFSITHLAILAMRLLLIWLRCLVDWLLTFHATSMLLWRMKHNNYLDTIQVIAIRIKVIIIIIIKTKETKIIEIWKLMESCHCQNYQGSNNNNVNDKNNNNSITMTLRYSKRLHVMTRMTLILVTTITTIYMPTWLFWMSCAYAIRCHHDNFVYWPITLTEKTTRWLGTLSGMLFCVRRSWHTTQCCSMYMALVT